MGRQKQTKLSFNGYLTVEQVARRLKIPKRTVLWQVTHDYLRGSHKIGNGKRGIWLIPESALKGYSRPPKGRPTKSGEVEQ